MHLPRNFCLQLLPWFLHPLLLLLLWSLFLFLKNCVWSHQSIITLQAASHNWLRLEWGVLFPLFVNMATRWPHSTIPTSTSGRLLLLISSLTILVLRKLIAKENIKYCKYQNEVLAYCDNLPSLFDLTTAVPNPHGWVKYKMGFQTDGSCVQG